MSIKITLNLVSMFQARTFQIVGLLKINLWPDLGSVDCIQQSVQPAIR